MNANFGHLYYEIDTSGLDILRCNEKAVVTWYKHYRCVFMGEAELTLL